MATLQSIGITGMSGLAPTPMQSYVVQNYLRNNELLNALRWTNIGLGSSLGNFIASVVVSDGSVEAVGRALGEEYTGDNEVLRQENITLKMLGGAILTDIEIQRAFKSTVQSVASAYTQTQIETRLHAIEKAFAKWFIQGDSSLDGKQFDGVEKYLTTKASSQVVNDAIDISNLDNTKALAADKKINEVVALMKHEPSFILTTRKGGAWLTTLNQHAHRNTETIEFNSIKYKQYNGLPIVTVDDSCFKASDIVEKYPLYFIYTDENEGVRVAVPADGQLMIVQLPKFDNGTGNMTSKGSVELCCAPIFERLAIAKTFITDKVAAASK